jgi:hypothetical protein
MELATLNVMAAQATPGVIRPPHPPLRGTFSPGRRKTFPLPKRQKMPEGQVRDFRATAVRAPSVAKPTGEPRDSDEQPA